MVLLVQCIIYRPWCCQYNIYMYDIPAINLVQPIILTGHGVASTLMLIYTGHGVASTVYNIPAMVLLVQCIIYRPWCCYMYVATYMYSRQ